MPGPAQYIAGAVRHGVPVATILPDEINEAAVAYALRDEVAAVVDACGAGQVVLDAGNVRFIGSVGLLAFLGVRRHLSGGRIVLCNLSPAVRETMQLCRLIGDDATTTAPFESAASVEEALARLAPATP
jgi:anti-anti-sigma factor